MPVKQYTMTINECDAKYQKFISCAGSIDKDLLLEMFSDCMFSHEEMYAIYLTNNLQIRYYERISVGCNNATLFDPSKLVVSMAMNKARRVILLHNHPSGNRNFSKSDIDLANKIKQGMLFLDFELVDFMVVCTDFTVESAILKGLI